MLYFTEGFITTSSDCAIKSEGFSIRWLHRTMFSGKVRGRQVCFLTSPSLLVLGHGGPGEFLFPRPGRFNNEVLSLVPAAGIYSDYSDSSVIPPHVDVKLALDEPITLKSAPRPWFSSPRTSTRPTSIECY